MISFRRNKRKIDQPPSDDRAKEFFHAAKYCKIHFLDHIFSIQWDFSALSIDCPHDLFLNEKCLHWTQNAGHYFLTLLHFCYAELWSSLDLVIKLIIVKVMSRKSKHLKKKKQKVFNGWLICHAELGRIHLFTSNLSRDFCNGEKGRLEN